MKTKVRDIGAVRVFDIDGKITIGSGDVELRQNIEESLTAGRAKLLLNLKGVSHIDSTGIGEMVGCLITVKRKGGAMKLLNLSPKINDILQVTQLITVFDVYDNEPEALESFTG
jgi:anti-sigma B factor antagonist